jgi:fucose 4-O-acetylase-like acetyltransferase
LVAKDWSALPFVSLALGYLGVAAVVAASTLAASSVLFKPLRYLGEKSLYIYLAFIFPMAAARIVLFKTGVLTDLGVIALVVTAAGLAGALAIYWMLRDTRYFGFLFERPQWFRIAPRKQVALQPAE